jgi:hypothetical protein
MKHAPKLIGIHRPSVFQLDPSLTAEEAVILRAIVAGQTHRHVCNELRMSPVKFLRIMRGVQNKTGITDSVSLMDWSNRHAKGIDQGIGRPERSTRPA